MNVKISPEAADSLLKEWQTNASRVLCVFTSDGLNFKFTGTIVSCNWESLVVADNEGAKLSVAFSKIKDFDRTEERLKMNCSDGTQLRVGIRESTR